MKIGVESRIFYEAMKNVVRGADKRSSMPVLANVLIDASKKEGLWFSTTDLGMGIRCSVDGVVEEEGSITVDADRLHAIAKNLPEGKVRIRDTENAWVHIGIGRLKYKMAGIPGDDFPSIPLPSSGFVDYPAGVIGECLGHVSFAASPDEGRPHLNGVLFEYDGSILKLVSTDGHRLGVSEASVHEVGETVKEVLPLRLIKEVEKQLPQGVDGVVGVSLEDSNAFFDFGDLIINAKMIHASFPPYDKVIPAGFKQRTVASREGLLAALKRVMLVSSEKAVACKMDLTLEEILISVNEAEIGEGDESVPCGHEGDELHLALNGKYLVDVLGAMDSEKVEIETNGSKDAMVIKPIGGRQVYVIMPMRL